MINENISRIDLHNSSFEILERNDKNVSIVFDWSILESLEEEGIDEPVVIGVTTFTINGVMDEKVSVLNNHNKESSLTKEKLPKTLQNITHSEIDDDSKSIRLKGIYNENGCNTTLTWQFRYDDCKIYFDSYYTLTEWRNGNLSDYLKNKLLIS